MRKRFDKILESTPDILVPSTRMGSPNEPIPIYSGEFTLQLKSKPLKIKGTIEKVWYPHQKISFYGIVLDNIDKFSVFIIPTEKDIKILLDEKEIGIVVITGMNSSNEEVIISGWIEPPLVMGDKSIAVQYVLFEIPNLREFNGDIVKSATSLKSNRLILKAKGHTILIDKHVDFSNSKKDLKNEGGYMFLYSGKLQPNRSDITYTNTDKILRCLSVFLYFLNGRRCSPVIKKGICADEVVWTDFTPYTTDPYTSDVISWPVKSNIDGLSNLWDNFYDLWKNEEDRDCIKTVIHWYIEANCNSGYVEGAIVLLQNAFELLYNWIIIEKKVLIIGDEAINLSAANKLRLLLDQINLETKVPNTLTRLYEFVESNQKIFDGPDVFIQIRNAIVHGTRDKRDKLSKIPGMVKYEALQLGLWYMELLLLNILKYKGKYHNRCSGTKWSGEGEEIVPWVKSNS